MANTTTIYPSEIAPFNVWGCSQAYTPLATPVFVETGSGSGWSLGSDLTPTAYADNGSGLVRVTVSSTASLATGQRVAIDGTTSDVYEAVWVVTVIDATHIDLQDSTYTVNPATKGTVKKTLRHNWLVVGWTTADEGDAHNSHVLNAVRSDYGFGAGSSFIYENRANGAAPRLATDQFFLLWYVPRKVKFHHISIYLQTHATTGTYDPTLPAFKVLPANGDLYGGFLEGNIPGWATTAVISSPTVHYYYREVPVLEKDTSANTVTIPGDKRHCLYDNAPAVLKGSGPDSGNVTVASVAVDYTSDGEVTVITVDEDLADATTGKLYYAEGPIVPVPAVSTRGTCTINIQEDMILNPRPLAELDASGNAITIDTLNDCPIDALTLSIPVTGIDSADSFYLLWKWMKQRIRLIILQTNDSGSISFPHFWSGRILHVPKTGGIRKHANGPIALQFLIDTQVDYRDDFGWYSVVAADTTVDTLTFNGDLRRWLGSGDPFYVRNSTGNDGLWVVRTISYSESTDITTILVKGELTNGTDDGYIEVLDW